MLLEIHSLNTQKYGELDLGCSWCKRFLSSSL